MKVVFDKVAIPSWNMISVLDGSFSESELANFLAENWVNFECHRCPKWPGDCIYAERNEKRPERPKEKRCGVGVVFLENAVKHLFRSGGLSDKKNHSNIIHCLYHLCVFAMKSEKRTAYIRNPLYSLTDPDEYFKYALGDIINLREHLNKAAYFGRISKLPVKGELLVLVEGETEQFFLQKYLDLSSLFHGAISVETYKGSGNVELSRLPLLIESKTEQGYACFLQGDLDGKKENQKVNKIISKTALLQENVFFFTFDFESSLPPEWVWGALKNVTEIDIGIGVGESEFVDSLRPGKSISENLKELYGVNITPLKMRMVKYFVFRYLQLEMGLERDTIMNYEIGLFMRKINKSQCGV